MVAAAAQSDLPALVGQGHQQRGQAGGGDALAEKPWQRGAGLEEAHEVEERPSQHSTAAPSPQTVRSTASPSPQTVRSMQSPSPDLGATWPWMAAAGDGGLPSRRVSPGPFPPAPQSARHSGCLDPTLPKSYHARQVLARPGDAAAAADGRHVQGMARPWSSAAGGRRTETRPLSSLAPFPPEVGRAGPRRRQSPKTARDATPSDALDVVVAGKFLPPRPIPFSNDSSDWGTEKVGVLALPHQKVETSRLDWDGQTVAVFTKDGGGPKTLRCVLELNHPHVTWVPRMWVEARAEVLENGSSSCLGNLFKLARNATVLALQRGFYTLPAPHPFNLPRAFDQHGISNQDAVTRVDLAPAQNGWPLVHWFARASVDVNLPEADQTMVPPPLIITDMSPFEVATTLRQANLGSRQVYVAAEISCFDAAGRADLAQPFSTNPSCLPLRTDFTRFMEDAHKRMHNSRSTFQQHLTADLDPYIFICPDVCVFRGPRDEGFPFRAEPFSVQMIASATSVTRPAIQAVPSRHGPTRWYACKSEHTAMVERLNLIAMAALQGSGYVEEDDEEEARQREDAPILILPAFGFGGDQFHPTDAFASLLRQWRRRFSPLFHSVYICCTERGSPDPHLATYLDGIVNKNIHRMAESDALADRMMSWHWEPIQLGMSISGGRMQLAARRCKPLEHNQNDARRYLERNQWGAADGKLGGILGAHKKRLGQGAAIAALKKLDRHEEEEVLMPGDEPDVDVVIQECPRESVRNRMKAYSGNQSYKDRDGLTSGLSPADSDAEFDEVPETSQAYLAAGLLPQSPQQEKPPWENIDIDQGLAAESRNRSITGANRGRASVLSAVPRMSVTGMATSMSTALLKEHMRSMRQKQPEKSGKAKGCTNDSPLPKPIAKDSDDSMSEVSARLPSERPAGEHEAKPRCRRMSTDVRRASMGGFNGGIVDLESMHKLDQLMLLQEGSQKEQAREKRKKIMTEGLGNDPVVGGSGGPPAPIGGVGRRTSAAGLTSKSQEHQEGIDTVTEQDIRTRVRHQLHLRQEAGAIEKAAASAVVAAGADAGTASRRRASLRERSLLTRDSLDMTGPSMLSDAMGRRKSSPAEAGSRAGRMSYEEASHLASAALVVNATTGASPEPVRASGSQRRQSSMGFGKQVSAEADKSFAAPDYTGGDDADDMLVPTSSGWGGNAEENVHNDMKTLEDKVGALAAGMAGKLEGRRNSQSSNGGLPDWSGSGRKSRA